MKIKKNEQGFGLVEGLLIVIALALVVGVGFYVVNANKDKEEPKTSETTSQKVEEKSTEAKKEYFEFKQFGVKIPLTDDVKGLKVREGGSDTAISVSTETFDDLVKESCPSGGGGSESLVVANLNKQNGKYEDVVAADKKKAESSDSPYLYATPTLLKQFDGFFIGMSYNPGGYGCYDANAKLIEKAKEAQTSLQEAFKSAEKL